MGGCIDRPKRASGKGKGKEPEPANHGKGLRARMAAFSLNKVNGLVFKGGTALAKAYFPRTWRLSEDLDFAFHGEDFESVAKSIESSLPEIIKNSGITFEIRSRFSNPEYLQLKIRYDAVLGRNWARIDTTKENVLDTIKNKQLSRTYSDYPNFNIKVESLEEIFAEKLRSLIARTKCRDYYDIWRLLSIDFSKGKLRRLFKKKCELKGIQLTDVSSLLPKDASETLTPYWGRELGRLVNPLPDLNIVLEELRVKLRFLKL
ncbi:MAG: nucleotidyl transferase AbiEii/AbiGii toxin family protein [bacterium]